MSRPLPEFTELKFIENLATGVVHIEAAPEAWVLASKEPLEEFKLGESGGRAFQALYETPNIVRCGQRTHPYRMDNTRHQYTNCFRDEQLCAACYRTLHSDDQPRAFEHEQPSSDDGKEHQARTDHSGGHREFAPRVRLFDHRILR